jgi:parallel beta-helix repeat protein
VGILLHESDDNIVEENEALRNEKGISLYEAERNRIRGNTVENGVFGIRLYSSHSNEIYHNNIINYTVQADAINSFLNSWNSSGEGNFWSDYSDGDLDRDGLGDVPYEINPTNHDHHPLLGVFHTFTTMEGKPITITSNSTITDINLLTNKTLQFQATNSTWRQHHGFCRICIPNSVMNKPYEVIVDGGDPLYWNYDLRENETHSWIYFNYEHSTREIMIVPEFLSAYGIILLVLGATGALITRKYAGSGVNKCPRRVQGSSVERDQSLSKWS